MLNTDDAILTWKEDGDGNVGCNGKEMAIWDLVWQLLEFIEPGFADISYSAMAERGAAPAEVTLTSYRVLQSEDDMPQVGLGYVRFVRSKW